MRKLFTRGNFFARGASNWRKYAHCARRRFAPDRFNFLGFEGFAMKRWGFALLVAVLGQVLAANSRPASAGEVGWIEDYSLATDRSIPLKQLIPGTEDFYFYSCLYHE